jgi:hypothetical protein
VDHNREWEQEPANGTFRSPFSFKGSFFFLANALCESEYYKILEHFEICEFLFWQDL